MEQKIKIIVCGAAGKMGSLIIQLALAQKENFIVKAGIEHKGHHLIGKTNSFGVPVSDKIEDILSGDEVVIDFSTPESVIQHLAFCVGKKVPFVTGVTGFSKEQMLSLEKASSSIPVFFSPNMSTGVNLFFEIVRFSAGLLKEYEIEISEVHHSLKKDAPSGTAKNIADIICQVLKRDTKKVLRYGREGITGARPSEEIGMHSIRMGDIVGEHYVYFGGKGEVIEIAHRCYNREAFASGALKAASFIVNKPAGFYSMKHMIASAFDV
ncbi:MAG TPA: 4-hydroxy-tetrahydrodipicolinate reductase [bacterium]|nr:4-hydroxy-tetrahydrodipicolinate reductase [bacterium]HPP29539.1 4-hydroxy-tetrahydrodipicolinate reductase [bacterium]